MPPVHDLPPGAPCWIDLMTSDQDRARSFYGELLGWEAEAAAPEFGGYFNFTKDGGRIAGCMSSRPNEGVADAWSVYLQTDDTAKTAELTVAHGGAVHVPPMAVADLGTMALVADGAGAAIGLWQPGAHPGFAAVGDPGTPSWFELHTTDYDAALPFYRDVFRWETEEMGDGAGFRYATLVADGQQYAGIMDASGYLAAGEARWFVYFGVDDADAALAHTVELGGAVVDAAEDTPYGRLATATDPMGATFKLIAPNEAMPANG